MKYVTPFLLKTGLYYPLRNAYFTLRNRGESAASVFSDIYHENRWQNSQTRSGQGSTITQTEALRIALPDLLRRHSVHTFLDIPCGDFHWMSSVNLEDIHYMGADIVPDLVAENISKHAKPDCDFRLADLCISPLPTVDMVFCRDCMVHLPYKMIAAAVANIRASGSGLLMATTFPETQMNRDIAIGDFRPINLQAPPFNFPPPIDLFIEQCTESDGAHADKAMGVWRIADLPTIVVA